MKEKTSISLNRRTLHKLKRVAKKRDRSVSFVVNEMLEQKFLPLNGSTSQRKEAVPA
jgi:predicted transcriptional regulator